MKKAAIPEAVRKELAQLAARDNSDIDYSDIPATSTKDWADAERGRFYRPIKQQLTVRIDADVVEWLKQDGSGYQSRLNGILRYAMLHQGSVRYQQGSKGDRQVRKPSSSRVNVVATTPTGAIERVWQARSDAKTQIERVRHASSARPDRWRKG